MKEDSFTDQLKEVLHSNVSVPSRKKKRISKFKLFESIEQLDNKRKVDLILKKLDSYYAVPSEESEMRVKSFVREYIRNLQQENASWDFWELVAVFSRKALASVFAFLLMFTLILGPFQTLRPINMLPVAQAAYLECFGQVYLNGSLCRGGELVEIGAGDDIRTAERSLATIFYPNYKLVRIDNSTEAELDAANQEQINLQEGSVWLNSPSDLGKDSLKITTPVLKARIAQGSVGIATKKHLTHLYTSTASVEIQIDSTSGSTEVLTVPPEKNVLVRKSVVFSTLRETSLQGERLEWVQDNKIKDDVYIEVVKEKTFDDNIEIVGVSPGGVRDYMGKLANSTIKALTWSDVLRRQLQLSELDKLFFEMLVLFQEGDQTIAQDTFEVYREKLISLLGESSDSMPQDISYLTENDFVKLLQNHSRLVSLYSLDDPEYVLKEYLQSLLYQLDQQLLGVNTEELVAEVSKQQLIEAHKNVSDGNIALAEEILKEAVDQESKVVSTSNTTVDTADLVILTDIAEISSELGNIVNQIKKKKIEKLRSLTTQQDNKEIVSGFVKGTAYKNSKDDSDEEDDDLKTVKIVGQAIRPSEDSL